MLQLMRQRQMEKVAPDKLIIQDLMTGVGYACEKDYKYVKRFQEIMKWAEQHYTQVGSYGRKVYISAKGE
jgi:hypothetical protein